MENYLTTQQAANKMGVTVRAVQKIIAENKIEVLRHGRAYVIPVSEIERYMASKPQSGWPKGKARKAIAQ